MADKITWIRPSGEEITTNGLAETVKYAAEHGWKPKDEAAEDVKTEPKRAKKGG